MGSNVSRYFQKAARYKLNLTDRAPFQYSADKVYLNGFIHQNCGSLHQALYQSCCLITFPNLSLSVLLILQKEIDTT